MAGQVDGHAVVAGGDGQVVEAGDVAEPGQVDPVLSVGEIVNDVIPVAGSEHEGVVTSVAVHRVVAGPAVDSIVTLATFEEVVAFAAVYPVVAAVASQAVRFSPAVKEIVPRAAGYHVGTAAAVQLIIAFATLDRVMAFTTADDVIAGSAEEPVRAGPTGNLVISAATVDSVTVIVRLQDVLCRGAAAVEVREDEVGVPQVVETDPFEADGAAALRGQVDRNAAVVGRDGEVGKSPDCECGQINAILAGREIGDNVVAVVASEYKGVRTGAAGEPVVIARRRYLVSVCHRHHLSAATPLVGTAWRGRWCSTNAGALYKAWLEPRTLTGFQESCK